MKYKSYSQSICRYPKPGRTNPFVSVYAADLRPSSDGRANLLVPPTYFDDKEKIIYAVTWANNKDVSLTWENRHQNYSLVSVCDVSSRIPSCKDSLVMTEANGWLELDQPPIFTKDGKRFAMILPAEGTYSLHLWVLGCVIDPLIHFTKNEDNYK